MSWPSILGVVLIALWILYRFLSWASKPQDDGNQKTTASKQPVDTASSQQVNTDEYVLKSPYDPEIHGDIAGGYDLADFDEAMREYETENPVVAGASKSPSKDNSVQGSRTDRAYLEILPGEKQKRVIEYGDGTGGGIVTVERTSLDVPEPCGFNFDDNILETHDEFDGETGEISDRAPVVIPNFFNIQKMIADWTALEGLLVEAEDLSAGFPADEILYYFDNLRYIVHEDVNPSLDVNLRGWYCFPKMIVSPLTKTGKVARYPIRAILDANWSEPPVDWVGQNRQPKKMYLRLDGYYMKDGVLGKGRIDFSNKNGATYILEFARDTKTGEQFVKRLKARTDTMTDEGFFPGETKILYPFGQD